LSTPEDGSIDPDGRIIRLDFWKENMHNTSERIERSMKPEVSDIPVYFVAPTGPASGCDWSKRFTQTPAHATLKSETHPPRQSMVSALGRRNAGHGFN